MRHLVLDKLEDIIAQYQASIHSYTFKRDESLRLLYDQFHSRVDFPSDFNNAHDARFACDDVPVRIPYDELLLQPFPEIFDLRTRVSQSRHHEHRVCSSCFDIIAASGW